MITEVKGTLGIYWDLKDEVEGFQSDGATASVHLRRITVTEMPLDSARGITGDLFVD